MLRRILLVLLLVLFAGCHRGDGAASAGRTGESAESATTTQNSSKPFAAGNRPPIDIVVGVVCDDASAPVDSRAEGWSGRSWKCTKHGEPVRIDFYDNDAGGRKAKDAFVAGFRGRADNRSLAQLPIVCGNEFGIEAQTVGTRDAL